MQDTLRLTPERNLNSICRCGPSPRTRINLRHNWISCLPDLSGGQVSCITWRIPFPIVRSPFASFLTDLGKLCGPERHHEDGPLLLLLPRPCRGMQIWLQKPLRHPHIYFPYKSEMPPFSTLAWSGPDVSKIISFR